MDGEWEAAPRGCLKYLVKISIALNEIPGSCPILEPRLLYIMGWTYWQNLALYVIVAACMCLSSRTLVLCFVPHLQFCTVIQVIQHK